jgi:hypothetical protein
MPLALTWTWGALGAILLAHAGLLAWSAVRASVTYDEFAHLPAGVAYWKYREFSIHNLSPPLLRMLGAWPAVLDGAVAPPASSYRKYDERERHWLYADAFMRDNAGRYHRYFVLGRLAMIPWSCLGAVLVFRWSRALFGDIAGVASCALYSFDPNILAHASLVGTDAGVAVALLGATYLWQGFCRAPTPARAVYASLATAAAILCKFTALLIVPVMIGIALWSGWMDQKRLRPLLAGLTICCVTVVVCVNLMYGYWRTFEPLGKLEFQSSLLCTLQRALPRVTPVPLPRDFVLGFDAQKYEAELRPPAYAMGEVYRGARWYYYPLTLVCKLPLAALALVMLTFASIARRGLRRDEVPLIVMLVVFGAGMALLAEVNVGLRYVLPILPVMFVLIGRVWMTDSSHLAPPRAAGDPRALTHPAASGGAKWTPSRRDRPLRWALIVLACVESLAVAPRFLTFFNLAAGPPARAQFILNDSNLDWGQGLIDLRDWMRDNHVDRIGLAYFGRVDPRLYGIEHTPLVEGGDEELIAVSSYFLTGMPHRMRLSNGQLSDHTSLPNHESLRRAKPLATVGRIMYIYRRADVE